MTTKQLVSTTPFSIERSFALQQLGHVDPTATISSTAFVKRYTNREGELVQFSLSTHDDGLVARFDGPVGEDEARFVEQLAALDTLDDGLLSFVPHHPVVKRLTHAFAGLRLLRVPWLFDVAAGAILQQRVSFADAANAFKRIALQHGDGGADVVFPHARRVASLQRFEFEALGIDLKRAGALKALAKEEVFRSFLHGGVGYDELRRRLVRVQGIGPWTTEMILGFGAGDADALPVGDLHLPGLVCRVLAGERDGTDARMLELLEPWRGHRFRVVRLLWSAVFSAPQLLRPHR
jgi:3-methyladenine DNA glycosylase/8-oxoguanine DNA glycosylase